MATLSAALSSKMSNTIRHLLHRHSSARSTAPASSASFSLIGKPVADNSPAELDPKPSPYDLSVSLFKVGDVRSFGRIDWPVAVEAAASGRRKVVPNEDEDSDVEDNDVEGFDFDDDDFEDDFDDDDDFEDEEEDKPKRKRD